MKRLTLLIALLMPLPATVSAGPAPGPVTFGAHFDFQQVTVYPAVTHVPAGKAPLYAASFSHPAHGMYVAVVLSKSYGKSTELIALTHEYVDHSTTQIMGWLPVDRVTKGTYTLDVRGHGTVLATGKLKVTAATGASG